MMKYYYEVYGRLRGALGIVHWIYFESDYKLEEIDLYKYFEHIAKYGCYSKEQIDVIKEVKYIRNYKKLEELLPYNA